jgi:murein DD-endopeptidase MepM/ murein hydrolase activator NlpD
MRLPLVLASAFVLLLAGSAGASRQAGQTAGATANAYAIKVIVPGKAEVGSAAVAAPRDSTGAAGSFVYPADGSIVKTGPVTASASTSVRKDAAASASSEVDSISLFGGEVTIAAAIGKATGSTRGQSAAGNVAGAALSGLTVAGVAQSATPNGHVGLGDWGSATTLEQAQVRAGNAESYRGYVTAIDIFLTADHDGLPAGSEIRIGYAEAWVQAGQPAPAVPVAPGKPTVRPKKTPKPPEPKKGQTQSLTPSLRLIPVGLQPKLTAGGYVFPVYGPSSFSDTFGAFRGDVSGNWHHGDDIFAPLGAPILACADGTVFSVGWNDVGGNRLWLRDGEGNEFYYAHLSAYTEAARNGNHVRAGQVIGFVGNTGDAQGTPYHLQFEVHPVAYLSLGYDGAVDPTPYLDAWRRQKDIGIAQIAGYLRGVSGTAPKPGAILLQASDISAADGLDPASLRRALLAPRAVLEGRASPAS